MQNYMVPDLEMMKNFEEAVYKKQEEINDGMAEMMSLLHEYMKGEAPEKVLVREDGSAPVVPKKGEMTVVKNEKDKLIPQRTVTGWRVCIDYRKLNNATRKDHFPLPFINQMLERLAGHEYYCFLDGFLGYFHIHIASKDQENTTFTCPYGTFAYKQMSFGLWNVPATFQRCMTAIFHELIENSIEVFMGDFSVSEAPLTTASM
ncbi:reverse transcriptase domain-containing protein [Tanacetum coccineum]